MRAFNIIFSSIIALSSTGCTSNSTSVQIEDKHNLIFTQNGTMEVIRVYPNDTIESISTQKHVPIEILAAINNLSYPYHLYNVRTLMIPHTKYHKVQTNNESLKSIANKYRIDTMQLMDVNDMTHIPMNKRLQQGIIIKIPEKNHTLSQHAQDESLSPAYNPTKDYDVMELNEIKDDNIDIQHPIQNDEVENNISKLPPQIAEEPTNTEFETDLQNTLRKQSTQESEPKQVEQINNAFKTLTPLNSQSFIWPLTGKVSRDKNDGLSIFAPLNTAVRAIGNGKVIFAENDNGEYGNLIIIKHDNGYLSAYAHNNQLLVKKGDSIKKGQTISKVGKSGKVSKSQLFFSMRKDKEIIHPESE